MQFQDTFPGTTLDTTKWHVNDGTPTVSGGVCTLNGGAANCFMNTIPFVSVDAAPSGIVVVVSTCGPPLGYANQHLLVLGSGGDGYAITFDNVNISAGTWGSGYTQVTTNTGFVAGMWVRFQKSGANMAIDYSTTAGASWSNLGTIPDTGLVTTSVQLLPVAFTGSLSIGTVTIDGTPVGGGIVDDDFGLPQSLLMPRPMQWIATVFS